MTLAATARDAWKRHWEYRYGLAAAIVVLAAALRLFLGAHYGVTPPFITFYPATMLAAVAGGTGPGILATLLSLAFAAIFLMEPEGYAAVARPSDLIALGVFLFMGLLVSAMAGMLSRMKEREHRLIEQ